MYALADTISQNSSLVLKRLSNLAIELCDADSAGVSVVESSETGELFRWQALAGEIEQYVGGTTPRDWSPCGECLKAGRATLYSYPARYFTYFQALDRPIVEGLVIPMLANGSAVGTIWIMSHTSRNRFDAEHVRIMASLAIFATRALREHAEERADGARGNRDLVWDEYMRRIIRRDEFALAALFEETYPLVLATALRIVSFRTDAEEVAADVFARVWKKAETFDSHRGNVGSWLISMTRNGAIDKLRACAVRGRSETALLSRCSASENLQSALEAAERLAWLKVALEGLPFEQRRAIELFYFSEMSAADIARELRQPIGTVKTRIRLGRFALRRLLAALEPAGSTRRRAPLSTRKVLEPTLSRLFEPMTA